MWYIQGQRTIVLRVKTRLKVTTGHLMWHNSEVRKLAHEGQPKWQNYQNAEFLKHIVFVLVQPLWNESANVWEWIRSKTSMRKSRMGKALRYCNKVNTWSLWCFEQTMELFRRQIQKSNKWHSLRHVRNNWAHSFLQAVYRSICLDFGLSPRTNI